MGLVSGLRVLKLEGYWGTNAPPTKTILALLRASPALEEIVLRNLDDDDEICGRFGASDASAEDLVLTPPTPADAIRLPRLRRMTFLYAGTARVRALFAHMVAPALEHLELVYPDNVSPILGFLKTQALTALPLRSLRLESCSFSELRLAQLLERLPSLVSLELVDLEDATASLMKVYIYI
jgi:hypothetical protein